MSIFGNKEPDPPKVVLLDDSFAKAVIGINVSAHDPPRMAYSLVLLTNIVRRNAKVTEEQAREQISKMVRQITTAHKGSAPVFIDDSQSRINRTPAKGKNRIITRGGRR